MKSTNCQAMLPPGKSCLDARWAGTLYAHVLAQEINGAQQYR